MAFVMTRNTRQSLKSGVAKLAFSPVCHVFWRTRTSACFAPPVKSFNAVVRSQNKRPLDWAGFHGLMRCFVLQTKRFTASHAYYPQKLVPTVLTKLIGPEPRITHTPPSHILFNLGSSIISFLINCASSLCRLLGHYHKNA